MYVYPSLDPKFHQIQKMLMYRVRTTLMYDCVTRNNDTKIILKVSGRIIRCGSFKTKINPIGQQTTEILMLPTWQSNIKIGPHWVQICDKILIFKLLDQKTTNYQ